jgi:hypothetical protein
MTAIATALQQTIFSAIHQIIDENDWVDEPTGRAAFNEAVSRRKELEEGMR